MMSSSFSLIALFDRFFFCFRRIEKCDQSDCQFSDLQESDDEGRYRHTATAFEQIDQRYSLQSQNDSRYVNLFFLF
jgi:hypothetical protein